MHECHHFPFLGSTFTKFSVIGSISDGYADYTVLQMATLLPPPKRVKVYHGVPEPEPEIPRPSPNIVVQFVSEDDGKPLAPAVNLPANVSREGLEALVNKLSTQVWHFQSSRGSFYKKMFMMSG